MIIVDAHLDISWNALNWSRDVTQSVRQIRALEAGMKENNRGSNTVAFPEMRRGQVAVCLATMLARASGLGEVKLDYPNQEIACAMAQGQLAYYRLLESEGMVRILKDWDSLDRHIRNWHETPGDPAPLGFILSMEGADPIVSPGQVIQWWEDGLRVIGLAHFGPSAYAHGTGPSGGLTAKGRELLKEMNTLGMILDVTHLADEGFWQAVDAFPGCLLASHCNCRALVPGDRQLSDEQIRVLIERDAVIGAVCDGWMLYPGWVPGRTPNTVISLESVVDHIDHVCQLAGNVCHAAIGSDLDGGYGREQSPHDLDTIADLQNIAGILRRRGYRESDVEAIMHGNWLELFQKAWTKNDH
jgi:membrane dipeptidase